MCHSRTFPTRDGQVTIIKDGKAIATIEAVDYLGLQALQVRHLHPGLLPPLTSLHSDPPLLVLAVPAISKRQRRSSYKSLHRAPPPSEWRRPSPSALLPLSP